jgi:hypothetical protein
MLGGNQDAGVYLASWAVPFSFNTGYKEMNSSTTFCPAIFVPFVTAHNLPNTISDIGIICANAYFRANYFEHFDMLSAALASRRMTTLGGVTYD